MTIAKIQNYSNIGDTIVEIRSTLSDWSAVSDNFRFIHVFIYIYVFILDFFIVSFFTITTEHLDVTSELWRHNSLDIPLDLDNLQTLVLAIIDFPNRNLSLIKGEQRKQSVT